MAERDDLLKISDLAGGDYVDLADVAAILGVSESQLRVLMHEKSRGGRGLGDKERKASGASKVLPAPLGQIRATVWKREDVERALPAFKEARRQRSGRRPSNGS